MVDDFFIRNRLDQMTDLRHSLVVHANRMPWHEIDASLDKRWTRQIKVGKKIVDLDLFGLVSAVTVGGTSNAGRTHLPSRKAVDNRTKLYSWQAPKVECISKRKSRKPYEFGVKVGLALTFKSNLIVGARKLPFNPYDWHTMRGQVEQSKIQMQGLGVKPELVYADLGYRGVNKDNQGVEIKHQGKDKRLSDEERRLLKRRQALDPIIGHLKADQRMDRCYLKGSEGGR